MGWGKLEKVNEFFHLDDVVVCWTGIERGVTERVANAFRENEEKCEVYY
jgi:hypothetical protein